MQITPFNYSLDVSLYGAKINDNLTSDTVNDLSLGASYIGRALYAISFESIPFSGMSFRNGVDTRYNRPITVEFNYDQNMNQIHETIRLTPIIEYDTVIKIGENGLITKEF